MEIHNIFQDTGCQKIDVLKYTPTPVQEIHDQLLAANGIRLLIKREDLNHAEISGNKWWKLKYNIEQAIRLDHQTLLTVGGAFSNHIYATAAAARETGLKSIGIIRGEETLPLNRTLSFAQQCGMELHYVSREEYRYRHSDSFLSTLHKKFGDFYFIPEGGTNALALEGTTEFARTLLEIDFSHLFVPVGTGGTIAGIIQGFEGQRTILGVSVLKGDFLKDEVDLILALENNAAPPYGNWSVLTSYHHGGYARTTPELSEFIQSMRATHDLPLDPVYTGKLLWAVMEEVKTGAVATGSTILALHTGGLQGTSM